MCSKKPRRYIRFYYNFIEKKDKVIKINFVRKKIFNIALQFTGVFLDIFTLSITIKLIISTSPNYNKKWNWFSETIFFNNKHNNIKGNDNRNNSDLKVYFY